MPDQNVSVYSMISSNFSENHSEIFHISIQYLLHNLSSGKFTAEMKSLTSRSEWPIIKDYRLSLKRSGYFVLHIRACLFALVRDRSFLLFDSYMDKYGIHPDDAPYIREVARTREVVDHILTVDHHQACDVENIVAIKSRLRGMLDTLRDHSTKYVLKKLWFVAKSSNINVQDLAADMLVKATEAYYWMFPTNKRLSHIINYLRRVCTNQGLNLIQFHTASRRSRLIKSGEGFDLKVVSENQIKGAASDDKDHIHYENIASPEIDFDADFSIKRLMEKWRGKTKTQTFIKILSGYEHKPFISWLRKAGRTKEIKAISSGFNIKEHLQLVSDFLQVSIKRTMSFVKYLRAELA